MLNAFSLAIKVPWSGIFSGDQYFNENGGDSDIYERNCGQSVHNFAIGSGVLVMIGSSGENQPRL